MAAGSPPSDDADAVMPGAKDIFGTLGEVHQMPRSRTKRCATKATQKYRLPHWNRMGPALSCEIL